MMIKNFNYTPTFGANFINQAKIGKLAQDKSKYADEIVSFVKINTKNKCDLSALDKAASYWENDKFAANIAYVARSANDKNSLYNKDDIYALTLQRDNFENLESNKILGLIDILPENNNKSAFIEYIQVKPSMIYFVHPKYKGIGTAILASLKKMYDSITCVPLSEKSVKDFYKRNGFVKQADSKYRFFWEKE